jgi:hypothetical protein
MKIKVNTDGSFELDTNGDSHEALKFIRELQSNKPVEDKIDTSELNQTDYETWTYLVEHDSERGVHYQAFARAMGITDKIAHNRLYRLKGKGYAVFGDMRGYYRAKG